MQHVVYVATDGGLSQDIAFGIRHQLRRSGIERGEHFPGGKEALQLRVGKQGVGLPHGLMQRGAVERRRREELVVVGIWSGKGRVGIQRVTLFGQRLDSMEVVLQQLRGVGLLFVMLRFLCLISPRVCGKCGTKCRHTYKEKSCKALHFS